LPDHIEPLNLLQLFPLIFPFQFLLLSFHPYEVFIVLFLFLNKTGLDFLHVSDLGLLFVALGQLGDLKLECLEDVVLLDFLLDEFLHYVIILHFRLLLPSYRKYTRVSLLLYLRLLSVNWLLRELSMWVVARGKVGVIDIVGVVGVICRRVVGGLSADL
jgi:hypothetical protein